MNLRKEAVIAAQNRISKSIGKESYDISENYNSHVFNYEAMQKYLSSESFDQVLKSIESKEKMSHEVAEVIASAMKSWALSKGATHYTHWFQPLTGLTAQKHESFFSFGSGRALETFKGSELIQQKSDASDFPTGGLRSTFEARGYTAWDPSSPAFILEIGSEKTLCIPTIFVSYTGEALDYKSPLLKSVKFLDEHATAVCSYLDRAIEGVMPMLGCEQEFYLIDEAFYNSRPDLLLTGRTLVGAPSPKGQEAQDHYFAAIPDRISEFLLDVERECFKLGIPLKTRHNEVGPSQYEVVPEFEDVNVSIDHNLLLMDLMRRIAKKHKLAVLLHEKPFNGINGSAKHNNWSLRTDTGKNLFAPAATPRKNILFLIFFINTIKAIRDNADILRACIASAGNDLRLGSGGAPPSILTVYIGKQLTDLIIDLEKRGEEWLTDEDRKQELKLDIHAKIPDLLIDNTDENRTAAIAFTGDKFEIRNVGSSHNPASPMIVMNTILGSQLAVFKKEVDALISSDKLKKDTAILTVLKRLIPDCHEILFSDESSSKDAEKRLGKVQNLNAVSTPDFLSIYLADSTKDLFSGADIFTAKELEARHDNLIRKYTNRIEVESRVLLDVCLTQVIPCTLKYLSEVNQNLLAIKQSAIGGENNELQIELVAKISDALSGMRSQTNELRSLLEEASNKDDIIEKANFYSKSLVPMLRSIRSLSDRLESVVSDELWNIPKSREILYLR